MFEVSLTYFSKLIIYTINIFSYFYLKVPSHIVKHNRNGCLDPVVNEVREIEIPLTNIVTQRKYFSPHKLHSH